MERLLNKRILYRDIGRVEGTKWGPGTKNSRTLSLPRSLKGQNEERVELKDAGRKQRNRYPTFSPGVPVSCQCLPLARPSWNAGA